MSIARTATKQGSEAAVERASFSVFHEHLAITPVEVQHKLRFRFLNVVALALFCDYLLLTLCVPVLPAVFGDSFSAIEIGLVFASKPIFQFLANPYMGSIVDLHGPKYPLLLGVIVLALSTFLFAFGLSIKNNISTAYAVVIVARSVQGVASASTMSAGMTLSALTHHESNRGTAMGIAMLGVALGTLSGPPIGGIMGNFLPLWTPYVVVGALLLCNAAAQLYVLHRPSSSIPVYVKEESEPSRASRADRISQAHRMTKFSERATDLATVSYNDRPTERPTEAPAASTVGEVVSVLTLLKNSQILFIVAVAVTGNSCIGMIEPLIPLYLRNTFNQSILQQGLIFATATGSYLVFTPIAGIVSDSYPKWGCLCIGLAALAFGFGFLLAATGIFRVCVSLFFIGGGMSFIDTPSLPLLSEVIEREDMLSSAAGQVYALSDMALCVGFALGPILGPLLQQAFGGGTAGFQWAALVMGVVCAVMAPLPFLILRDTGAVRTVSALQTEMSHTSSPGYLDGGSGDVTATASHRAGPSMSPGAGPLSPLHHRHDNSHSAI